MFFERGAEPGEKFPCPVAGSFGELIEIVLLVRGDEDDVVAAVGVRRVEEAPGAGPRPLIPELSRNRPSPM